MKMNTKQEKAEQQGKEIASCLMLAPWLLGAIILIIFVGISNF